MTENSAAKDEDRTEFTPCGLHWLLRLCQDSVAAKLIVMGSTRSAIESNLSDEFESFLAD
jgi:hypothetical protein